VAGGVSQERRIDNNLASIDKRRSASRPFVLGTTAPHRRSPRCGLSLYHPAEDFGFRDIPAQHKHIAVCAQNRSGAGAGWKHPTDRCREPLLARAFDVAWGRILRDGCFATS